ncbi:cadherin-like domain-containing protein [Methylorubrum thiocyanatum]|uniref:cadherin-like domain-containing protein n=1 Tax=Methylorubrum thiocyanatum TaxID=47958 RepID=UPI003F7E55EC
MTIEIKGTKPGRDAPEGAERYVSRSADRRSSVPYYAAVAVATVAAYLKSLLLPRSILAEEVDPEIVAARADALRLVHSEELAAPAPATAAETPKPRAEPPSPILQSGMSLVDDGHELLARGLRFARLDPHPDLGDFKASPIIPQPINDNGGSLAAGSGGRGGGQPSGGGGPRNASHPEPDAQEPGNEAQPAARPPGQEKADRPDQGSNGQGSNGQGGSNSQDPAPSDGGVRIPPDSMPGSDPRPVDPATPPRGRDDGPAGQRNRAPVVNGPVQLGDVAGCALLTIALSDLLHGASDPDGDALSVRDVRASSGTVTADGSGWVFDADAPGPVTITYAVTDGEFSIARTAHLTVLERALIGGTDGDDLILGTPCADDIAAGAGDDNVDARGGDDLVEAGSGNDHVIAGDGSDTVLGGPGDDVVFAGAGADRVSGGAGHDRLFGEAGDDLLFGEAGDDLLDGGEGRDILDGGDGDDLLLGGEGNDSLYGAAGADDLSGGAGADVLVGEAGDDRLQGGEGADILLDGAGRDLVLCEAGDDVIILALDGAADTVDGGAGRDTLDLSAATVDLVVDLRNETLSAPELGIDRIASIEAIIAGSGDDRFVVDGRDLVLTGGGGGDVYAFAAPDDPRDGTRIVQITDFSVGDYIDLVRYALFKEETAAGRPLVEALRGESDAPTGIQVRFDRSEGRDRTVVSADLDQDDAYETTVVLEGEHLLRFTIGPLPEPPTFHT